MPETLQRGFTQEAFETFLQTLGEPEWLTEKRREYWDLFQQKAWPSSNEEEWRRTDIRLFKLDKYSLPLERPEAPSLPDPLLSHGVELAGSHRTLNSFSVQSELDPELAAQGVLFGSLSELVHQHEDLIRPNLLTKAVDPGYDKFSALQAACWSGGTLLYVPKGVKVEKPFHILSALADGGVDLGYTLVILEDGADATLMLETGGDDSDALHCGAIELLVGPKASLRFVSLQEWGTKTWHFAHQKAVVDRDARLQWTIGALGAKLAKVNQHVSLVGPGADAQVNGVQFTERRQHIAYHTLQHHEAGSCHSDLLYKGGLQDKSSLVWRGMIKVDPDAQKTNAYQRDDNLLLSSDARADSIPGLEIEADDVICTHGATAGRIDEDLIFYCQTRGFTRNEAMRTIVAGFFQQVFDRITIESVRQALADAIGRRIRAVE